MVKFVKCIGVVVFFILNSLHVWCEYENTKALMDELMEVFKLKDKGKFTNLFYLVDERARGEAESLIKYYVDELGYDDVYLWYDKNELNKDKVQVKAIFIKGWDCTVEFWDLYIFSGKEKKYILRIDKQNIIPNLKRYIFNKADIKEYRNLNIKLIDGELSFKQAYVMKVGGVSRLHLIIGKGKFVLKPSVGYEKRQMRILSKKDYFEDDIDSAIINENSKEFDNFCTAAEGKKIKQEEIKENLLFSFLKLWNSEKERQLRLSWLEDISPEAIWLFDIDANALKVRIKAQNYGDLIYYYAPNLPFTVQLFKEKPYMIYAFYNPLQREKKILQFNFEIYYSIRNYDIKVEIKPEESLINGSATITVKSLIDNLKNIELSISEQINIKEVIDQNYQKLVYFKSKQSKLVNVYLSKSINRGDEIKIAIYYYGIIKVTKPFQDYMQEGKEEGKVYRYSIKPIYFYEGSTYWYPQSILPEFSNGRIEITIPSDYLVLVSGQLKELVKQKIYSKYIYETKIPAKHFSLMITKNTGLKFKEYSRIRIIMENDFSEKQLYEKISDIINFYEDLLGKLELDRLDIYNHYEEYKGGYAQSGFIILINKHPMASQKVFKGNNPLNFPRHNEFYIAHELAHLWWGHSVSFLTYQDQWISEGLSQYLAAKYIKHTKGEKDYYELLNKFVLGVFKKKEEGPIILGQRLGLINKDRDAYGAIVYNKTALALEMLENVIGEKIFLNSLKEFYQRYKYKFASTYNFIEIVQNNCRCGLGKFFSDWFYSSTIPEVHLHREIKKNKVVLRFKVSPKGVVPIPVEIIFKDGSRRRLTFIVSQGGQTITTDFEKEVKRVDIINIFPFLVNKN